MSYFCRVIYTSLHFFTHTSIHHFSGFGLQKSQWKHCRHEKPPSADFTPDPEGSAFAQKEVWVSRASQRGLPGFEVKNLFPVWPYHMDGQTRPSQHHQRMLTFGNGLKNSYSIFWQAQVIPTNSVEWKSHVQKSKFVSEDVMLLLAELKCF